MRGICSIAPDSVRPTPRSGASPACRAKTRRASCSPATRTDGGNATAGLGNRSPVRCAIRAPTKDASEMEQETVPAGADPRRAAAARLVGQRDAHDAFAADRAHDAVLAQPLRVEPAEGAVRRAHVSPERHAARQRARQFRRPAARHRPRPGDGDLPRQCAQPQGNAQREFRARGDGAVHAGRRQLQRAGHQGGGTRLYRLEHRPRQRRHSCSVRFIHDYGTKTVLGRSGNLDGDDVLDVLLRSAPRRSSSRASYGANSSRPIRTRRR